MNTQTTNDPILRPAMFVAAISRIFAQAWQQVDQMRAARGRSLPDWPDWCFMPLSGAYAIASRGGTVEIEDLPFVGIIGALAAWRTTKGIYRFDPTVLDALWETPVAGDLPRELLFRLPEWCPYILTPGKTFTGLPLHGFFVHLEHDAGSGRVELRFVLDVTTPNGEELMPVVLHLVPGGLAEAVAAARRESARLTGFGEKMSANIVSTIGDALPLAFAPSGYAAHGNSVLEYSPLVSTVLYLCSQAAEVRDRRGGDTLPARPAPTITRKGSRLFGPARPVEWQVAYRLGAAQAGGTDGSRSRMRPHYRRAHWHSFWTGRRAEPEQRELLLKWLPPIAVNVDDTEQLVPAIRAVA